MEHAFAIHLFKDWRKCTDPEQHIPCLLDDYRQGDCTQKEGAKDKSDTSIVKNL